MYKLSDSYKMAEHGIRAKRLLLTFKEIYLTVSIGTSARVYVFPLEMLTLKLRFISLERALYV